MGDNLRAGVLTSFTGGELTPQLAGRVDKEEMKIGSRYVSNFIPEHQGGLKKFYGSGNIGTIVEDITAGYRMIPFDGCGEPLCLLFTPSKTYCVTRDEMYQVSISVSFQSMLKASFVQSGDVMYITNEDTGQFVITYSGRDETTGHHKFSFSSQKFVVEPFFPLNWQGNYNGLPLHTSASSGYIAITGSASPDYYSIELPEVLKDCGSGKNITDETDSSLGIYSGDWSNDFGAVIGRCKLELHRVRSGNDEIIKEGYIGVERETVYTWQEPFLPSHGLYFNYATKIKFRWVDDQFIINMLNPIVGNTGFIEDGCFNFTTLPTTHQAQDLYYFQVSQEDSYNTSGPNETVAANGYVGVKNISRYTERNLGAEIVSVQPLGFDSVDMVGRKIKISMEHDLTGSGVKSWAEDISVSVGNIVYSDGHYYECMAVGSDNKTGQTQPTHTYGTYSDGKCSWKYLHSGYGYITITSVEDETHMHGKVDSLLPYTSGDASAEHDWNNYQWSMWGYKSKYPNQVFMFNGRLGYTLDTAGYGSWLQLSKADEFDDFSTEEFGEVTDICGINTLISEYNENRINWIISGYRLYMGSYAGEYNISGGDNNKSVITPSSCNVLPVSQAGGGPVKAVKFEDLNLFASGDRKQLFSLKYDYTSDDYIPSDIGFAGEDLLESGIAAMWHLRGYDRNLYLRTDNKKLVVINQPEDVKVLGFFRVNMLGSVLDHCVSNANGESVLFTLIERGTTHTVEYIQPEYKPYMLNTKQYVPASGETHVASTITDATFAGQTVYVYDGISGEFQREVVGNDGVVTNPFETTAVLIGIEMPCEIHTHPLYNDKFETAQQKSVRYTIRVIDSGAFSYGSSNDFNTWYDYYNSNTVGEQEYSAAHKLMTGDIHLPSSFGYQQAQNKADSKYPNDSAVALSLKAVTPEPFNLLLVSSIYV